MNVPNAPKTVATIPPANGTKSWSGVSSSVAGVPADMPGAVIV